MSDEVANWAEPRSEVVLEQLDPTVASTPPEGFQPPSTRTAKTLELPFDRMQAEHFERLLLAVATHRDGFRTGFTYGRVGEADHGMDVLGQAHDGTWRAWQAKRYTTFGPADLRQAVTDYLRDGNPHKGRVTRLTIGVACKVSARVRDELVKLVQEQAVRAGNGERSLQLEVLDEDDLVPLLQTLPDVVGAYFGEQVASQVCVRTSAVRQERARLSKLADAAHAHLRDAAVLSATDPATWTSAQDWRSGGHRDGPVLPVFEQILAESRAFSECVPAGVASELLRQLIVLRDKATGLRDYYRSNVLADARTWRDVARDRANALPPGHARRGELEGKVDAMDHDVDRVRAVENMLSEYLNLLPAMGAELHDG